MVIMGETSGHKRPQIVLDGTISGGTYENQFTHSSLETMKKTRSLRGLFDAEKNGE